jgi:hypothetical protein
LGFVVQKFEKIRFSGILVDLILFDLLDFDFRSQTVCVFEVPTTCDAWKSFNASSTTQYNRVRVRTGQ